MFPRFYATIALLLLTLANVSVASPNKENNGNNELPKGRPFQTLQGQIDMINVELADLEYLFNTKFLEVDEALLALDSRIAANENDIEALEEKDKLQDEKIALLDIAIEMLDVRIDNAAAAILENAADIEANEDAIAALNLWKELTDSHLEAIDDKLGGLETRIDANAEDLEALYLADQAMQLLIDNLDDAIDTIEALIAANVGDITSLESSLTGLQNRLASAEADLASKQNRILQACPSGFAIRQVYSSGNVACVRVTQSGGIASQTRTAFLQRFSFCETSFLGFCTDTEYYYSRDLYCLSSETMVSGGFMLIRDKDLRIQNSRPITNGWAVRTNEGDDSVSGAVAYVRCIRLIA